MSSSRSLPEQERHREAGQHENDQGITMELPLFPLNVVLFPGMVQALHIFEPRYREMIGRCVEERNPFGIVLSKGNGEAGITHSVGTAARIVRVEHLGDGRMNITAVGTQRFRILDYKYNNSYLSAEVAHFPVVNGSTKRAVDLAQVIRPRIMNYIELLSQASNAELEMDRLPQEPTSLAFLTAMALQIGNEDKQKLLTQPGVPDILQLEKYLLSRETMLLQYMVDTQEEVEDLSSGPTGYLFPN